MINPELTRENLKLHCNNNNTSLARIAEALHLTPQGLNSRLKDCYFSLEEWVIISATVGVPYEALIVDSEDDFIGSTVNQNTHNVISSTESEERMKRNLKKKNEQFVLSIEDFAFIAVLVDDPVRIADVIFRLCDYVTQAGEYDSDYLNSQVMYLWESIRDVELREWAREFLIKRRKTKGNCHLKSLEEEKMIERFTEMKCDFYTKFEDAFSNKDRTWMKAIAKAFDQHP